jgi:hypothetical protein
LTARTALAVWALVQCSAVTTAVISLDREALKKLAAGDAIVSIHADEAGEADGHIEAVIDIAAAPETVFAVMVDCDRALKFVSELTSCKIIETAKDGSYDVREHRSRWLSILPEMVSVFRSDYVVNREIRFSRVGGDLAFLEGAWHLDPLQGGKSTRLTYDARVGIAMPIPAFMIRGVLETDVPKLLKALRAEVLTPAKAK